MQPWFIPMFYVSGAVLGGLALPRIEQAYLSSYTLGVSVASAQALLSAAASGMMALTGIVFAMAFVMVQFSAIAYSPRLVLWFARDRTLFHALGAFTATFIYALFTIAWVDRASSAKVPLVSMLLVGIMIIVSMLLFSRLMQRLGDLQIGNVLHLLGDQGRAVIGEMFLRLEHVSAAPRREKRGGHGTARPRDPNDEVFWQTAHRRLARRRFPCRAGARGTGAIVMACAVGDTLVEGSALRMFTTRQHRCRRTHWARHPSQARAHLRAGHEISDPASCRHRHQGVVTRDQRPDDSGPDHRPARGPPAPSWRRRTGCRLRRRRSGALRLVFPTPTWEDYLSLAFDEIRHFGSNSVQVMRRMRSALVGLAEALPNQDRVETVRIISSTSTVSSELRRSTSRTRRLRARKTGRASACLGGNRTRPEPAGRWLNPRTQPEFDLRGLPWQSCDSREGSDRHIRPRTRIPRHRASCWNPCSQQSSPGRRIANAPVQAPRRRACRIPATS